MPNQLICITFAALLLCAGSTTGLSQSPAAKVVEEVRTLKTYPFSDPNPIPILTENPKIYPYFKYEGYSRDHRPQEWKVVKLENDLVEVTVLPEIGGKVWGAIEKATGREFIYRNEVMKFRNIAMRGPWTSGGIEFNFGIIGHHPSTATPVDYVLEEHEDGSVSCTVGNIDLPSRTQWRVRIRLPKDKANFATEAMWYNSSPVQQAYYNWMTAAAPALPDFQFYTPGDQFLQHNGKARPWPYDEMGRNISKYRENNFGPSKSYHVVGEYNDFFGGYYHDAAYGFGHWGNYDAIPGQKLWLWALSRSGGIWEDLLTDTDGQYIEFQAGRLFVQYAPGDHRNPITQATFEPHTTDQWREVWFPINNIGGISEASDLAVMNVAKENGQLTVSMNAFQKSSGQVVLLSEGKKVAEWTFSVLPMERHRRTIDWSTEAPFEIVVKELDLHYFSHPEVNRIKRPFQANQMEYDRNSAERYYREALEHLKARDFQRALEKFQKVRSLEPLHLEALVNLGELSFRSGRYEDGLGFIDKALRIDTYHAGANYMAGLLYRAQKDWVNAKESFGWAARSTAYRSAAYTQLAEVLTAEQKFEQALQYAAHAIDFNRFNISAWHIKAIAARKLGDRAIAEKALREILKIDPLNHQARFETYLWDKKGESKTAFVQSHRSELVQQTFLELAISYANLELSQEAAEVLQSAPASPMIELWKAYLNPTASKSSLSQIAQMPKDFVFPFRRESLAVLQWATQHSDHWVYKYYLALNLWGKGRDEEAGQWLKDAGSEMNYAPAYSARAHLLKKLEDRNPVPDLKKAMDLKNTDWRNHRALTRHLLSVGATDQARQLAQKAVEQFPDNYTLGMEYAKTLLQAGAFEKAISILNGLNVLPFEGAAEGRQLYEKAHHRLAIRQMKNEDYALAISLLQSAKKWPENLGVGKPFEPDDRISDYLLGICYQKIKQPEKAKKQWEQVAALTRRSLHESTAVHVLGIRGLWNIQKYDESQELLQALLQGRHGESDLAQWIRASSKNNLETVGRLKKHNPKLATNATILLLEEVLQLGEP